MPEMTGTDQVAYDDIPTQPRDVLDEVFKGEGAEQWWNDRNRYFGSLRPRDVWRTGYSGEVRVMSILNLLAEGDL